MARRALAEGAILSLGSLWIDEERAHNFSLYARHADRVTLLLCGEEDVARPVKEVVLFCLLFLANGIPIFAAGDEFMRTPGSIARSMSLIRDKKRRRPRSDTGSWPDQWWSLWEERTVRDHPKDRSRGQFVLFRC
ncbi:MAG TPA: hypothetical protein VHS97_23890 [Isosphaeraceae bacterium]|nr:hypothetical protein [Isosphaeraceae bacterium]